MGLIVAKTAICSLCRQFGLECLRVQANGCGRWAKTSFWEDGANVIFSQIGLMFELPNLSCNLLQCGVIAIFQGLEKIGEQMHAGRCLSICDCKGAKGERPKRLRIVPSMNTSLMLKKRSYQDRELLIRR